MSIQMPEFEPNTSRKHVEKVMKATTFLDIETSLLQFYGFRTGMQRPGIESLVEGHDQTRLLTAAWGTWWDMYHDGAEGVTSVGNHHRKGAFKKDPLDDTYVLKQLWKVMDESTIIVAHNASFDAGWIEGRFMELGWKMPSRYFIYCTYQTLAGKRTVSKKLDFLSQKLVNTEKVSHDGLPLWIACSNGDVEAFEKMEEYNIGDIYDTLYKVFMRTAPYVSLNKCIDLAGDGLFCTLTGDELVEVDELYRNRHTGLEYTQYLNPKYNIMYRDRYNVRSKKAGLGYIRARETNQIVTGAYG